MNVTRDVIYDLLPGYFAGDISPATRALVDDYLQQDPEFRQMMERFRAMFREPGAPRAVPATATTATATALAAAVPAAGDREAFERTRALLHKRSELRGYLIAFGLAGLFVFFAAGVRLMPPRPAGPWLIAMVFLAISVIAGFQLYRLNSQDRSR
jgi:anti-sigma factor RsiW